ncbi:xylulokinase [Marinitenerispora sediminis]|uniref:Sugar kinase n=1 Tax=Marinitenerispora sediminis TaxID=1931232 RepID=A0A368SYD1_9ACTN|nr:FGGY family carbohydrate kinase [Marinitenerispora sediminis]RCV47879.1 sugar kinase [Marinitenerispora sediminis]RCV49107.1 sugar kinase [Marinitenerispora sediminis]RCV52137.1 sugar kinase [Marinitenerispora sediminis]
MAVRALLGIDLGTSGVKALVTGVDGAALGEADAEYPVVSARPGWAETDPGLWWSATVRAVRAALAGARERAGDCAVAAIGLDGQMHGLVLADAAGRPVRPALLWADQRAAAVLGRWTGLPAGLRGRLANPLVPGMTGPLLRWVAEHEPEAAAAARWALLPKDWLRLRLTGAAGTEPSDASATLLWDVPADGWSAEAAAAVDLPERLLPPVLPSGAAAGGLTAAAARELGVAPDVPVAAGAGDTPAALLATGLRPGQAQVTVGSGAQVVTLAGTAEPVPGVHVYRTATAAGWYRMAAVQNAGIALDWVRGLLGTSWPELYESADTGAPGADGVTFVPHLTGERTPVLDPAATGALSGLRLASDRGTVLRAALEGVALSVRHAASALPGGLPPQVRLAGGGTRHPAFRRLLADVLGVELHPVRLRSASALGAALLAAEAAGLPAPPIALEEAEPVRPGERSADYEPVFARYLERVRLG